MELLHEFYKLANGRMTGIFVTLVVSSFVLQKMLQYKDGGVKGWGTSLEKIKSDLLMIVGTLCTRALMRMMGFELEAQVLIAGVIAVYADSILDYLHQLGWNPDFIEKLRKKFKDLKGGKTNG